MESVYGDRMVRLVEATSYPLIDSETGAPALDEDGNVIRRQLPKGRPVLAVSGFGIPRPTMHGGGKHGDVVDVDTGARLRAIFEELPGR